MPTVYPLPTLAGAVDAFGITTPPYADIYTSLRASMQAIYGADVYIDPDSQDGQLLAIVAQAIADGNDADVGVFNSFSPATAQGSALSSGVRINGISRAVPSNSQVVQRVTGNVGATIVNGVVSDTNQNRWLLPPSVTIPVAGFIDVTATAQNAGAIAADIGTITVIVNPQLGWQTTTNPNAASQGAPVESDAALRRRQVFSTALPSQTVLSGTWGAIANITGVTQLRVYENDTSAPDANGQPANSIAAMVIGGDSTAIAQAILVHKTPGAFTYGTTTVVVTDPISGIPYNIRFSVPVPVTITAAVTIKALTGYTSSVGTTIQQAIVDYVNGTAIGGGASSVVEWDGSIVAVRGVDGAATFKIASLTLSGPGGAGTPDVPLLFNQVAAMVIGGVTLTVT